MTLVTCEGEKNASQKGVRQLGGGTSIRKDEGYYPHRRKQPIMPCLCEGEVFRNNSWWCIKLQWHVLRAAWEGARQCIIEKEIGKRGRTQLLKVSGIVLDFGEVKPSSWCSQKKKQIGCIANIFTLTHGQSKPSWWDGNPTESKMHLNVVSVARDRMGSEQIRDIQNTLCGNAHSDRRHIMVQVRTFTKLKLVGKQENSHISPY